MRTLKPFVVLALSLMACGGAVTGVGGGDGSGTGSGEGSGEGSGTGIGTGTGTGVGSGTSIGIGTGPGGCSSDIALYCGDCGEQQCIGGEWTCVGECEDGGPPDGGCSNQVVVDCICGEPVCIGDTWACEGACVDGGYDADAGYGYDASYCAGDPPYCVDDCGLESLAFCDSDGNWACEGSSGGCTGKDASVPDSDILPPPPPPEDAGFIHGGP